MDLLLEGGFEVFPSSSPGLVFYLDGSFTEDTAVPPFTPTEAPPDSLFASPPSPINLVFSNFMIESGIWATNLLNYYNITITDNDLPADSPIHLNVTFFFLTLCFLCIFFCSLTTTTINQTNDKFFLTAVPGLKKYPDMGLAVSTGLLNVSNVDIKATGIQFVNYIELIFTLLTANGTQEAVSISLLFFFLTHSLLSIVGIHSGSHS
jgi:hypothetical protein